MKKFVILLVLVSMMIATPLLAKVDTQLVLVSNSDGVLTLDIQAKSDDGEPLISLYRGAFKISETLENRVKYVGFDNLIFNGPEYEVQIGYSSEYRKVTWIYTYNEAFAGDYESIPEDWLSVLRVTIMFTTGDEKASLSWAGSPSYMVLDDQGNDITGDYMPISPDLQDIPLPVEMSAYSAVIENDAATVSWRTETELNNLGFHVYRSENEDTDFAKVTTDMIRGQGSTSMAHEYTYVDDTIEVGKNYWYLVETISIDGLSTFYGPTQATVSSAVARDINAQPTEFALKQNYPNPFNPSTQIRYELSSASQVNVTIYDILGSEVRSLVNQYQPAGAYSVSWDGTDNSGQRLESGIFIYEMRAGQHVLYQKMTMLK
jgi:hypothetical protein